MNDISRDFEVLSPMDAEQVNGGLLGGALVGAIYGGIIGLSAVVFSGNATSFNNVWKGYVAGAIGGGAIGLAAPI